jgi:hypothetical protein
MTLYDFSKVHNASRAGSVLTDVVAGAVTAPDSGASGGIFNAECPHNYFARSSDSSLCWPSGDRP